ncbi:MAG: transporter substrate-binding domain-containing protein [Anaerolineales bacterium]
MKRIMVLSFLLIASMALAACGGVTTPDEGPSDVTTDLGGRTINVAVENAYPPYNFIDEETNEAMGWDYDAFRAICDLLNCVPNFVEAAWEGIFEATAAGEYDVVADGVTCSGEVGAQRDEIVDFSIVYGSSFQSIVVRIDETAIVDEASLIASDVMVGTQIGTTNEAKAIELVGEARVLSYDTFDLPVTALIAGDVDAVIMDGSAAEGFLAQNPDDIKILPEPITGAEEFCFVFPPGSELIEPINYAIETLEADGTLDDLEAKWWPQE